MKKKMFLFFDKYENNYFLPLFGVVICVRFGLRLVKSVSAKNENKGMKKKKKIYM
jgi:hypothetical protein